MRAIDAIRINQRHARTGVTRLAPILAAALACTTAANAAMIFGPLRAPRATNYTWNGSVSNNWSDANNWTPPDPQPPPGSGDSAVIPSRVEGLPPWNITVDPATSNTRKIAELLINGNAVLSVQDNLTVTGDAFVSANVTLQSANNSVRLLRVEGNVNVGQNGIGLLTIGDKGKVITNRDFKIGVAYEGSVTVEPNGKLEVKRDVRLGGINKGNLVLKARTSRGGFQAKVDGRTIVGAAIDNTNTMVGSLTVENNATYRSIGEIIVAEEASAGAQSGDGQGKIEVKDGGKIDVSNADPNKAKITVNEPGGAIDVGEKGIVTPKNSIHIIADTTTVSGIFNPLGQANLLCDLELLASSVVDFTLGGLERDLGYDSIHVLGDVFLDTDLMINLEPGFEPPLGSTFRLLEGYTLTGEFTGLPDRSVMTADGQDFLIRYRNDGQFDAVFARAIPSTGAGALAAVGLGLIVIRRTRIG